MGLCISTYNQVVADKKSLTRIIKAFFKKPLIDIKTTPSQSNSHPSGTFRRVQLPGLGVAGLVVPQSLFVRVVVYQLLPLLGADDRAGLAATQVLHEGFPMRVLKVDHLASDGHRRLGHFVR